MYIKTLNQNLGWTCPKCDRVWSPNIGYCSVCNSSVTIPMQPEPFVIPTGPTVNPWPWTPVEPWVISSNPMWAQNPVDKPQ